MTLAALEVSLRIVNEAPVPAIARHIDAQATTLLSMLDNTRWGAEAERLRGLQQAGRSSSVTSLHHLGLGPEGLRVLCDAGARQGVYSSVREGYLRLALHGWHTLGDLERVARWLGAA